MAPERQHRKRTRLQRRQQDRQGFKNEAEKRRRLKLYRKYQKPGKFSARYPAEPHYYRIVEQMMTAKGYGKNTRKIKDREWKAINRFYDYERAIWKKNKSVNHLDLSRESGEPLDEWIKDLGYKDPDADWPVGES